MESSSYQSESTIQEDNSALVGNQRVSHLSNGFPESATRQLTPAERREIILQMTTYISSAEIHGNYEQACLSQLGQINSDRAGVAAAALKDSELLQSLVELFESKWISMGMY